MKQKINLVLSVCLLLSSTVFLTQCGQETVGDMVSREQDRERERQNYYEDQNKEVIGVYQSSTKTYEDVFLYIQTGRLDMGPSTEGISSVPGSTLGGVVIVSPKLDISSRSERIQYAFPITRGSYDSVGKRLVLNLKDGQSDTSMTCQVGAGRALTCDWILKESKALNFVPSSATAMQALNTESKTDMVYTGHNDKFNILVQFDSGMISRDGSQIPEPTILGSMVFFNRDDKKVQPDANESQAKYSFKSGTYAVLKGQLTLTMDDDSQVVMVCKILKQGQSLDCIWHTRVRQEFILNRTVRR